MLTKKDLQLLKGMFDAHSFDTRRETQDMLLATEIRLTKRIDTIRGEIVNDISEFIDTAILPQLNPSTYRVSQIRKSPKNR